MVDYGPALYDPDGVLFDAVGAISGTPGSVLVARLTSPPGVNGEISVITPDQNSFVRLRLYPLLVNSPIRMTWHSITTGDSSRPTAALMCMAFWPARVIR